ncbi:hypothetical protein C5167_032330 [Papaver somniferum]|uniref:Uncharacterized protein n=1 Tax=Papaver somniferum TaxID=3469 RepID=A0A4Y7KBC3_PAPSO|nr:hypothetical protein C5167_032330 [Papaver somniferum]
MAAPNDASRGQEKQLGKFQGEEKSIVLAPSFSERVIVQGLMAAPNCPWRQAKRDSKSTAHESEASVNKLKENGKITYHKQGGSRTYSDEGIISFSYYASIETFPVYFANRMYILWLE